jgi:hypothetical protein
MTGEVADPDLVEAGPGLRRTSLNITQSITIVVRRALHARSGSPILVRAPTDQPCIKSSGLASNTSCSSGPEHRGRRGPVRDSCITGKATELGPRATVIRYDGDGSAIDVVDSRIELRNAGFIVRTRTAVVRADGPRCRPENVDRSPPPCIGFALRAGRRQHPEGHPHLASGRLDRLGPHQATRRASILSGMNRSQLVQIDDICMSTASRAASTSAAATRSSSTAPRSRTATGGSCSRARPSPCATAELESSDVGLYVAASGVAQVSTSKIVGVMRAGFFAERGAQIRSRDNRVYPREGGCAALNSGYFDGALTCRPWFEAPEVFRTPRDMARLDFESYWPAPTLMSGVASSAPQNLSSDHYDEAPVGATSGQTLPTVYRRAPSKPGDPAGPPVYETVKPLAARPKLKELPNEQARHGSGRDPDGHHLARGRAGPAARSRRRSAEAAPAVARWSARRPTS